MAALVSAFTDLVVNLIEHKNDAAKQEEALLAAEEKLSRIRAKFKFGA